MAEFEPAYSITRSHEGFYVFNPLDPGKETYAGVARASWANWDGWVIVDFRKNRTDMPPLQTNEQIAGLEGKVKEFYQARWAASRAGEINSQAVANIYFDFYILHSKAVRAMQETLNELGINVAIDNIIGSQTIAAINSADSAKLHDAYKKKRIEYANARVLENPSQIVFRDGWISRANSFPTMEVTGTGVIVVLSMAIVLYLLNRKKNKTQKPKKP